MKKTEKLNVQIKFINDLIKLLNERYNNLNNSERKEEIKSLIELLTQTKLKIALQKIIKESIKNQKK